MKLTKRVALLERIALPGDQQRIVIRFVGPGSENLTQPTEEDMRCGTPIITVQFVEGRPEEPGRHDARQPKSLQT